MKKKLLFTLFIGLSINVLAQKLNIQTFSCRLAKGDEQFLKTVIAYQAHFYNDIFDTGNNDSLPVRINLFGKMKEFSAVQEAVTLGFHSKWGFYSGARRQIYVFKHSDYISTIVHEASHSLLHNNFRNPPRWLNEGLADFFESLAVNNGKIYYQMRPYRIIPVKEWLGAGKIQLADFFSYNSEVWKTQTNFCYCVSYSIIYYLVKRCPEAIKEIVLLLRKGSNAVAAFDKVFGGFEKFENDYWKFYQ